MSVLSQIKAIVSGEPRKWEIIHTMNLCRVVDNKVVGAVIVQQDQYGNLKKTRVP